MQLHIEISKWCHFMTLTHGWRYSGKKKGKKKNTNTYERRKPLTLRYRTSNRVNCVRPNGQLAYLSVCYRLWYHFFFLWCKFQQHDRRDRTAGKYSDMPVVAGIGHMKPIQSENSIHWRLRRDGARSMRQRLAIVKPMWQNRKMAIF